MPTTLIASNPTYKRTPCAPQFEGDNILQVAEFFSDTVQGEGVSSGIPSTFLRLQGCTLECVWCDTLEVWRYGNPYRFSELFAQMDNIDLPARLANGQHLILTGGSPLKQQVQLGAFIQAFISRYDFAPYIEVENEAVLMPSEQMIALVDQWNNSPKLANSGMKERARYKPEVLKTMSLLENSWFKFVAETGKDWEEILNSFLDKQLIEREQIILMPQGQNQRELAVSRPLVVEVAIRHNVRFCDRLHVSVWDKKTGV